MLTLLKDYKGEVVINGKRYNSISDAIGRVKVSDTISISLHAQAHARHDKTSVEETDNATVYQITVKAYMTQKSSPSFDFMAKFNNDIPMPLRTMVGTIEKETRGMVYMKLHGDITSKRTMRCLCCCKPITNPVSQYFGMGPVCGGHNYVNPFYSQEELEAAVADYRTNVLNKITWEGWVIKSAITEQEVVD